MFIIKYLQKCLVLTVLTFLDDNLQYEFHIVEQNAFVDKCMWNDLE